MKKMELPKKSYFYVLTEDKECTDLEEKLLDAFKGFQKNHKNDSEVIFLHPDDPNFSKARNMFGITQIPAFVITDEANKIEKGTNPFISFNRPSIEKFSQHNIINVITDIHYILLDQNILRVQIRVAKSLLFDVLRDLYTEIKDFINFSL